MKVVFRKITPSDDATIARIIRTVMPEFGANGAGFAIHDSEVDNMSASYTQPRSSYTVCEVNGRIIGGAGVAPLEGGDSTICELKKMYFLPEGRGKGYGRHLLSICLTEAKRIGFEKCYLETLHTMKSAISLYEANGFKLIPHSLGNTGHFGCDTFYLLELKDYFPDENI